MSATQLMADLARLGIRLEAHEDRLRYSPRSAVTPDLADRMKAHKGELLTILRADEDLHTPVPEPSIDVRPSEQTLADKYERINEAFATFPKPVGLRCCRHDEQRWWQSIFGDHLICGICHPPATSEVVKEWHKNDEVVVAK